MTLNEIIKDLEDKLAHARYAAEQATRDGDDLYEEYSNGRIGAYTYALTKLRTLQKSGNSNLLNRLQLLGS